MLTRLPHRLILQTLTRTVDEGGAYTDSWANTETIWANVQPLSEREKYDALKSQQFTTHNVIIREQNITNANRFLYGSRILHIETVEDPTERGRMMVCKCREEVGN